MADTSNDWQQERAMSPKAFERAIADLGLRQAQAGRWLGVSERTARRYISGEAEIPPAQVLLLRAALKYRIRPLYPRWNRDGN
jgi:hypothetical protein